MDSGIALIGTILLAICILPFAYMHLNRLKKGKKMLQALATLASQQNCSLTEHELCGDFAIGIDRTNRWVFFVKEINEKLTSQHVNLADIANLKVVNFSGNPKSIATNPAWIKQIDLCFTPISKKDEIRFELYREDVNMQLTSELALSEKWSKMIQEQLKIRQKTAV